MNIFSRGQKGKLADLGLDERFSALLNLASAGMEVDVACFGLDAAGKLSDDRYMVFFNQKSCPGNAVSVELDGAKTEFRLNLQALPASIDKLVFTAAIGGQGTMRQLGASSISLGLAVRFDFTGADFQDEKAVIVAELYRKDGQWRFGAVGQGFNGGLSALLKHFGGAEVEASSNTPAPASSPPEQKKVSLSKVTLEKRGDKVSLEKRDNQAFGKIRVNLNWNRGSSPPPEKKGLFGGLFGGGSKKGQGIDLDLGCLFQLADGRPGAVQALGDAWGNFDQPPFIRLDADDRTGNSAGGENMFINGAQFDKIKRVLIYSFIYEGVPNWGATDGVVTIELPDQPPIEVRLSNGDNKMMCAIAMLENNGGKLQVTKLVEYFSGYGQVTAHQEMDERFGFGLRWGVGSKD